MGIGVERFLDAMQFEGRDRFVDQQLRELWISGSRIAGYVKQGGNLTFVTVLGGSHMVPMDKRPQTLDLLERVLQRKGFGDLLSSGPNGEPMKMSDAMSEARQGVLGRSYLSQPRTPISEQSINALAGERHVMSPSRPDLLVSLALITAGAVLGLFLRPLGMHALHR